MESNLGFDSAIASRLLAPLAPVPRAIAFPLTCGAGGIREGGYRLARHPGPIGFLIG